MSNHAAFSFFQKPAMEVVEMRRVARPKAPAKVVCFVGTTRPLMDALQAFNSGLTSLTAGDSGNTWTGTLTVSGWSVEVVVVHAKTEEEADALDARWIVKTQEVEPEDLAKWPMSRKVENILTIHTVNAEAAPGAIQSADKLLKSLVSGTNPLGHRPSRYDPCTDRYRRSWIPIPADS